MNDLLVDLLPVMLAATLTPMYPIVVMLLLQGQGGLGKAAALVSGAVAVRLAQGVLFGLVFRAAAGAYPDDGSEIIASTLLLVVGILLLIAAYKKWRRQEDPDDPPRWITAVGGLSRIRSLAAGALLVALSTKQWVFTLTAIDIIEGAAPTARDSAIAYLIYILVTQLLVLVPILATAVAPQRSATSLDAARSWLERNNRVIVVGASLVFGFYFVAKGINSLMG